MAGVGLTKFFLGLVLLTVVRRSVGQGNLNFVALPCETDTAGDPNPNDLMDNLSCPSSTLSADERCLSREQVCNNMNECPGNEDEGDPNNNINLDCDGTRSGSIGFFCDNSRSLSNYSQLCDGHADCVDGGDETRVICENKCLGPYYGGCAYTRQCLTSTSTRICGLCLDGFIPNPNNISGCLIEIGLDFVFYSESETTQATGMICARFFINDAQSNGSLAGAFLSLEREGGPNFIDQIDAVITSRLILPANRASNLDFEIASKPVTLSSTTPTDCVTFDIVDDGIVENVENFEVFITTSTSFATIRPTRSSATVQIIDNDQFVEAVYEPTTYVVDEANGTVFACIAIVAHSPAFTMLTSESTVTPSFIGGDATDGSDYVSLADPTTLTFEAGTAITTDRTTTATRCFQFPTFEDNLVENTETVMLGIGGSSGLVDPNALTSTATVSIINDDVAEVSLDMSSYTVNEDGVNLRVFAQIVNTIVIVPVPFEVTVSTIARAAGPTSATANVDYDFTMVTLTFELNSQGPMSVDIPIDDDAILEQSELFDVQLLVVSTFSNIARTTPSSFSPVTILDNDAIRFAMNIGGPGVPESMNATVTVTPIDIPIPGPNPIIFTLSTGDASDTATENFDYTGINGVQLTFPVGSSAPMTVLIIIEDDLFIETNETFTVHAIAGDPRVSISGAPPGDPGVFTGTLQIIDNDNTTVEFTSSTFDGVEGNSMFMDVCVRATLSGAGSGVFQSDLIVTLTSMSGTADDPADYELVTMTVTFTSTDSSGDTKCIEINLKDDLMLEGDETVTVSIMNSGEFTTGTISETTVTIEDEDRGTVTVGSAGLMVTEGGATDMFCVVLMSTTGATTLAYPLMVNFEAQLTGKAEMSDFTLQDTSIVISAGTSIPTGSNDDCITVTGDMDTLFEADELFDIVLLSANQLDVVSLGVMDTSTVTINNDINGIIIGFESSTYNAREIDGFSEVCIIRGGDTVKTFTAEIVDIMDRGTASNPADYESTDIPSSITETSFDANNRVCYNITLKRDRNLDGNQTIIFALSSSNESFVDVTIQSAVFTIIDSTRTDPEDPIDVLIAVTIEEVRDIVSSGNQTETNLQEVSVSLNEIADIIENNENATVDSNTLDCVSFAVGEISREWSEVLNSSQESSLMLLNVVESIGNSLLSQLANSTEQFSCQEGFFILAKKVSTENNENLGLNNSRCMTSGSPSNTAINVIIPVTLSKELNIVLVVYESPSLFPDISDNSTETLTVDSTVVGLTINSLTILSDNITIIFQLKVGSNFIRCVFYDFTSNAWEGDGCFLIGVNNTGAVVCRCNHLTNFAIQTSPEELMCGEHLRHENGFTCNCKVGYRNLPDGKCIQTFTTMVNMMYQAFDVENVSADNLVESMQELQMLVDITDNRINQSPENFQVITGVLNRTSSIVTNNNFNATQLMQVVESFASILDDIQDWQPDDIETDVSVVELFENVADTLAVNNETTGNGEIEQILKFEGNNSAVVVERGGLQAFQEKGRQFIASRESDSDEIITSSNVTEQLPSSLASIQLPSSLFEETFGNNSNNESVGLVFSFFQNAILFPLPDGTSENLTIRTPVIGALLGGIGAISGLEDPIVITLVLQINETEEEIVSVTCVSYDFAAFDGVGNWTEDGCSTTFNSLDTTVNIRTIRCNCNHLTNFAALADIRARTDHEDEPPGASQDVLQALSYIGVSLSIVGLILTIITMMGFSKLRNRDVSKFHVQLSLALLGMLLVFLVGIDRTEVFEGCVTVSVLIHYFTLVSVMWMGAEALLMFQKLVIVFVQITTRYIIMVSLICWLSPLLPVGVSLSIKPRFMVTYSDPDTEVINFCFIGEFGVLLGAFLIPILVIITFNLFVFVMVIRVLYKHSKKKYSHKDKQGIDSAKRLLLSAFGITFLFGLSWGFGALTISDASPVFQWLFTIFTSLQGFFIFFFFCVLGKEARESWIQLICRGHKLPWTRTTVSQQGTTGNISTGGTGSTGVSSNRRISLGSIYLRRPSATPTLGGFGDRRTSGIPSEFSESSVEMDPMGGTIHNLHAIQEEEEEEEEMSVTPPPQPTNKKQHLSNTESMLDLSLNESSSNRGNTPQGQESSVYSDNNSPPNQVLSSTDMDSEVLENRFADM